MTALDEVRALLEKNHATNPRLPEMLAALSVTPRDETVRECVRCGHQTTDPVGVCGPCRAVSREQCLAQWPDAVNGDYNPACCRFPKSCSIEDPRDETVRRAAESVRALCDEAVHGGATSIHIDLILAALDGLPDTTVRRALLDAADALTRLHDPCEPDCAVCGPDGEVVPWLRARAGSGLPDTEEAADRTVAAWTDGYEAACPDCRWGYNPGANYPRTGHSVLITPCSKHAGPRPDTEEAADRKLRDEADFILDYKRPDTEEAADAGLRRKVEALAAEWGQRAMEATSEPLSWRRVARDLRAALDEAPASLNGPDYDPRGKTAGRYGM